MARFIKDRAYKVVCTCLYTVAMIVLSIAVALGAHASCGKWALIGHKINGSHGGDESGQSVSLSDDGTVVAIGAHSNDNAGVLNRGQTRIYKLKNTQNGAEFWEQRGSSIYGPGANSRNGYSVSLSGNGNRVAIGEYYHSANNILYNGQTRIFEYNGTDWNSVGNAIIGASFDIWSGVSVSLSTDGNRVAIGAWKHKNKGDDTGQTKIYVFGENDWGEEKSIDGEAERDNSGKEVSLSGDGNTVAIGAFKHNGANGTDSGHVQIYRLAGTAWNKLGSNIDGEAALDESGYAVKLSNDGNTVAIGSQKHNGENGTDSGHVRIFDYGENKWNLRGGDIYGEGAGDYSGCSVDISGDGSIVAIGAIHNDGDGGTNSGHARIYHWNGNVWKKRGQDIDGEESHDNSGVAVSLSNDGNIVAIGANKNDGNGQDSGNVGIYRYNACPSPAPPAVSSSTSSTHGAIATVATAAFFQFGLF